MDEVTTYSGYNQLIESIGAILKEARSRIATAVNTTLVQTYWNIGRYIVEYEQNGSERAEYGSNLLNRLSADLSHQYGKGFSRSNILYMRKFYICFPNSETVSHILSWSHFFEILKSDDPLEISFYAKACESQRWSVRELKRQKQTALFQRFALSKDKDGVKHEDIGQMNLYLNYFKHEVCTEGDNEPFGIVLGAEKDRLTVQYALEGISNKLFVSRYQTYLPDREALTREVYRIIEAHAAKPDGNDNLLPFIAPEPKE